MNNKSIIYLLIFITVCVVAFCVGFYISIQYPNQYNVYMIEPDTDEPDIIHNESPTETQEGDSITSEDDSDKEHVDNFDDTVLGTFLCTAYCGCVECSEQWGNLTSTGVIAQEGRTIAVDPNVIPYGSIVVIDGVEYVAEDCGGAIQGNRIDIYFDTHEEACNYGVQYHEVVVK